MMRRSSLREGTLSRRQQWLLVLVARGGLRGRSGDRGASCALAVARGSSAAERPTQAPANIKRAPKPNALILRLSERQTGNLHAPVQDAAAVALGGGRAMLLGGLTAADTSRPDIRIATLARRPRGRCPPDGSARLRRSPAR